MPILPIIVGSPDNPSADTLWTTGNTCNTNFAFLDDSLRGRLWDSALSYLIGDVATEDVGGTLTPYIAITNNTNQQPSAQPTHWQEISGGGGGIGGGEWSAATTYSDGDIVSFGNYLFISLQDSNLNQNPGTATTYWKIVLPASAWDAATNYVAGDIASELVTGTQTLYISKTTNLNSQPSANPTDWQEIGGGSGSLPALSAKKVLAVNDAGAASFWAGTIADEAVGGDANFLDATLARRGTDVYQWTRRLKRHMIQKYLEDYTVHDATTFTINVNTDANIITSDLTAATTINLNTSAMPLSSVASFIHILTNTLATWPGITYNTGWSAGTGTGLNLSDQFDGYAWGDLGINTVHMVTYLIIKDGTGNVSSYGNVIGTNYD